MPKERVPRRSEGGSAETSSSHEPESERELIVLAKPEAGLRAHGAALTSVAGAGVADIAALLEAQGAVMTPLFGESEERLVTERLTMMASAKADVPDLSVYYRVTAPDQALDSLATSLRLCEAIETAYVKPPAYPSQLAMDPGRSMRSAGLNAMMPVPVEAPPVTPDFTARQTYLDTAPGGIDARYAWTLPGGRGAGVRVIDVEGAWRFTHEDLRVNQGGVVGGTPSTQLGWRNHGTAVLGEISGDVNVLGITGISPDANVRGVSIFGPGTAGAIHQAADLLGPGDIILIELHRGGPRATGMGQQGFIAIEWWPDDFDAIRYAVSRGVVVVEAAGNGAENLDDAVYDAPSPGFPASWRNPFRRGTRDSGAILVGAGAPPPGTHGRDHGPDRSRLDFSNFGSAVDTQGWGREVTTTGYGDLQGGSSEDLWYTDTFSGTSSASPIVVGTLGCVQGALRAAGRIPLSPARSRDLLRATGSPQTDAPARPATQRIGSRPNLRQLIPAALQTREWIGVQFTGLIPANATQRWFTHSWPAHWHVAWSVVPTSPKAGGAQIQSSVQVERASDRLITYWISITNLTPEPVNIEARYAVLGW